MAQIETGYVGALPKDFVDGTPITGGPSIAVIAAAFATGSSVIFCTEKRREGVRVFVTAMQCDDRSRNIFSFAGVIDVGEGEIIHVWIKYWSWAVTGGVLRAIPQE